MADKKYTDFPEGIYDTSKIFLQADPVSGALEKINLPSIPSYKLLLLSVQYKPAGVSGVSVIQQPGNDTFEIIDYGGGQGEIDISSNIFDQYQNFFPISSVQSSNPYICMLDAPDPDVIYFTVMKTTDGSAPPFVINFYIGYFLFE